MGGEGEHENGNTRRDGRRCGTEGGKREKDARTEPRRLRDEGQALSLLKVVAGRWDGM